MEIGKRIKQLRASKDFTQEDLALKLGVSVQAVSRWETGVTYPDITLLPVIANMFDVTVDYLLDVDIMKKKEQIREIIDRNMKLYNEGKIYERKELMEEAVKKYPSSWDLKDQLMDIYFNMSTILEENNNEYVKKVIELGNEILDKCTDDSIRFGAMQALAFCYIDINDLEKAKEIVLKLPIMIISRDWLYPDVVKGEERIEATQHVFVSLAEMFYQKLITTFGREELGKRDRALLKGVEMFKIVYEEGDYGFYNERIADLYMLCAIDKARIFDKEKTIEYLNLCFKHLNEFIKIYKDKKIIKKTSFLVDRVEDDPNMWVFNHEFNYEQIYKDRLENSVFDFVREDEEFKRLNF